MPSLSMPLFVSVQDVYDRMQLQSQLADAATVITSAIIGAQLHIEAALGSKLVMKTHTRRYFTDRDAFSAIQPGGVFRLELPSAWVRTDSPFIVTAAYDWKGSEAATPETGTFQVEYGPGYLLLDADEYADRYVTVTCTTGFLASVNTPPLPTVPYPSYTSTPAPYNPLTMYNAGDTALTLDTTGDVLTWIALYPVTGVEPPNGLYWQLVQQIPVTPSDFDPTLAYSPGTAVYYTTIDNVQHTFLCIATTTPGNLPTSTNYWTEIVTAPEQIPMNLYEAIMAQIPLLLNSSESTNRSEQAKSQYGTLSDHSNFLLQEYFRLKGFSFRPVA